MFYRDGILKMNKPIPVCLMLVAWAFIGCASLSHRKIDEAASSKAYKDGLVAYVQDRFSDAKKEWEAALRYNPNNQKARVALERVKREMKSKKSSSAK
jgi:outer membrane protein assembly factor BamD (BamD/ComL family)